MAGGPAIAVLLVTIGVGLQCGYCAAKKREGKKHDVLVLSVTTGVVSLVFGLWAAFIVATAHFDLGVITFPMAFVASLYGGGGFDRCAALSPAAYGAVALTGSFT